MFLYPDLDMAFGSLVYSGVYYGSIPCPGNCVHLWHTPRRAAVGFTVCLPERNLQIVLPVSESVSTKFGIALDRKL